MKKFYTYEALLGTFPQKKLNARAEAIKNRLDGVDYLEIDDSHICYECKAKSQTDYLLRQMIQSELLSSAVSDPVLYTVIEENDEYGPGCSDEKHLFLSDSDGLRGCNFEMLCEKYIKYESDFKFLSDVVKFRKSYHA